MISSDTSYFGLRSEPFSKEIGDSDLWLPSSKTDVVEAILEACQARASVVLTGDPGVGKTCVLRAVRARLPQDRFRLTYCHNATLGRRDFYRQLCTAMGLAPSATAAAVFNAVSTQVQELGREKIHPVFLLDEAHLLHQDVMDHLHILLNYNWDNHALLSLVLVGLPELADRLALRRNRSLLSRVHYRLALDEASLADTGEYLGYRLRLAGAERDIFAVDAIAEIHDYAKGSLRETDRVATAAMRDAARRKRKLVDRDAVTRAIA